MADFGDRKRVLFRCEACGSVLIKRTSYLTHPHLRQDTYVCDNPVCGACYIGNTELTGLASPSGMPDARPSELPPAPAYARALALLAYRSAQGDHQLDLLDALPAGGEPATTT